MTRILAMICVAFLISVSVSACGKKNAPKPPDKESTYPQKYPRYR